MTLSIPFEQFPVIIKAGSVFDPVRKKWLLITPEELVRQHLLQYFLLEKAFPAALIKLEHPLMINTLQKRSDMVVYSREGKPFMLIECKAPEVKLNEDTLMQILRYNIKLNAPYLVLCNGLRTLCFHNGKPSDIPHFNDL